MLYCLSLQSLPFNRGVDGRRTVPPTFRAFLKRLQCCEQWYKHIIRSIEYQRCCRRKSSHKDSTIFNGPLIDDLQEGKDVAEKKSSDKDSTFLNGPVVDYRLRMGKVFSPSTRSSRTTNS
ncbi:hypothetical protein K1719_025174 [Acacia pycnantha]|nr:hypothetical protein K1719_025174 [Acacia pycnantha]